MSVLGGLDNIAKVGPHGYVHGWIKVGGPTHVADVSVNGQQIGEIHRNTTGRRQKALPYLAVGRTASGERTSMAVKTPAQGGKFLQAQEAWGRRYNELTSQHGFQAGNDQFFAESKTSSLPKTGAGSELKGKVTITPAETEAAEETTSKAVKMFSDRAELFGDPEAERQFIREEAVKNWGVDAAKVGPHGYTHGWVFHGTPGSVDHATALDNLADSAEHEAKLANVNPRSGVGEPLYDESASPEQLEDWEKRGGSTVANSLRNAAESLRKGDNVGAKIHMANAVDAADTTRELRGSPQLQTAVHEAAASVNSLPSTGRSMELPAPTADEVARTAATQAYAASTAGPSDDEGIEVAGKKSHHEPEVKKPKKIKKTKKLKKQLTAAAEEAARQQHEENT